MCVFVCVFVCVCVCVPSQTIPFQRVCESHGRQQTVLAGKTPRGTHTERAGGSSIKHYREEEQARRRKGHRRARRRGAGG